MILQKFTYISKVTHIHVGKSRCLDHTYTCFAAKPQGIIVVFAKYATYSKDAF